MSDLSARKAAYYYGVHRESMVDSIQLRESCLECSNWEKGKTGKENGINARFSILPTELDLKKLRRILKQGSSAGTIEEEKKKMIKDKIFSTPPPAHPYTSQHHSTPS